MNIVTINTTESNRLCYDRYCFMPISIHIDYDWINKYIAIFISILLMYKTYHIKDIKQVYTLYLNHYK